MAGTAFGAKPRVVARSAVVDRGVHTEADLGDALAGIAGTIVAAKCVTNAVTDRALIIDCTRVTIITCRLLLTEAGVRAAFCNHAEFARLTLDGIVDAPVGGEVAGVNRAWIAVIAVGSLLRTVTRYRVTLFDGALTTISALLNGEAAGLTVAQVKRTNVIGLAIHVLVAAVIRGIERSVGVVTDVRRARIEVIASVLLYAALVDVALHSGASVAIIVANDVRVDTTVNVRITFFGRACVSIVAVDGRVLTTCFVIAEIGRARHTVITYDGDGLTATLHEACVIGTRVAVVAVDAWV